MNRCEARTTIYKLVDGLQPIPIPMQCIRGGCPCGQCDRDRCHRGNHVIRVPDEEWAGENRGRLLAFSAGSETRVTDRASRRAVRAFQTRTKER